MVITYYRNNANVRDNSLNGEPKICMPGLESLLEKKGVVSYEDLLNIHGTKCWTFQEATSAPGLSKSENLINDVMDDVASMMNLIEEELHEEILQIKQQINRTP
ncbi:hypothetical protein TNCV_3281191 [Trichonephila clavipes]|nr:hypothetical protein TNCV_3281191 [Trichonephila clavipes]